MTALTTLGAKPWSLGDGGSTEGIGLPSNLSLATYEDSVSKKKINSLIRVTLG